jgi:uncharacterized protein (TIGR02217 family)
LSRTTVVARSGRRQTNTNWSRPLLEWDLELAACSEVERAETIAWLRAANSSSFRFRDWVEFEAGCRMNDDESLTYLTPVQIGSGTGVLTTFQLSIRAAAGALVATVPITKPVATGPRVYLNGVNQTSGWTLSAATGVVTFASAPGSGVVVAWAGLFDRHVEISPDALQMLHESQTTAMWSALKLLEVME